MAAKELWSKDISKPNFKELVQTDRRVNDWVNARLELTEVLTRFGDDVAGVQRARSEFLKAGEELARVERLAMGAAMERMSELQARPEVVSEYLSKICSETSKFVMLIELHSDSSQGVACLTIRTTNRYGQKTEMKLADSGALRDIFPSANTDPLGMHIQKFLERELKASCGLAIPFERGTKFHILRGAPLGLAKAVFREALIERAKDELARENHETVQESWIFYLENVGNIRHCRL